MQLACSRDVALASLLGFFSLQFSPLQSPLDPQHLALRLEEIENLLMI